ncbi:MAG: hypothetical protein JO001_01370 [Alphaproteobacteria bacterium]|nr:hypothetical protein [Alphaproteobacteria bacterium]
MHRLPLALAMSITAATPVRADILDLHRLYDRASTFVSSLIGAAPDREIIAPPGNTDGRMIVTPRATGPIRNILPRNDWPVRPD